MAKSSPSPRIPTDPHHDLFYGFPNSYGSLGYALRLKIELEPTKPFVHLRHLRFDSAEAMTAAIEQISAQGEHDGSRVDFLDGTVFSPTEQYLTLGEMVGRLPAGLTLSDYTGMDIYYRSIQSKNARRPHHPRLPLALGHRLVLVLARIRHAEAGDPQVVAEVQTA